MYHKKLTTIDQKNSHLEKPFYLKSKNKKLRILHVTNFNERLDGRLFLTQAEELIMV